MVTFQRRLFESSVFQIAASPLLVMAIVLAVSPSLSAETVLPSSYWRNTITFPSDAFRAAGSVQGDPGWIKFTIFTSNQTKVYFQDSNHFPFHYDFAHALVQEYQGLDHSQFDQITLYASGQQAILGAVIMPYWFSSQPPAEVIHEYGIQFVRQDPYDPAQVVTLFNLVKSEISASGGAQAFYFPTYEQLASAEENRDYFASNGIIISSPDRWAAGNVIYAPGWAMGTLKFFTADQITPAYENGSLLPSDILLTDGVPAEVPMVAGIVSLVPSTPSSHVAIISNTYGIPFVHLALAADQALAQQLVGHRIALRAYITSGNTDVRLLEAGGLTDQQVLEILDLKTPPPLSITPVTPYGAYSAPAAGLYPSDIRYFGGKAANYGLIQRSIPANSRIATAFSFDLWTAFMAQTMPDSRTLGQTINDRLAGYTYPPASMAALSADLAAVRDLIKDATFSPELQAAILDTLQDPQYDFDPDRNLRFRSSTNVEDSEQFTGAGLYDSFSGCLADDLDGDSTGPSICDPTETNERGVFRAIRKVYASFYNENAFLQRLRYQVPAGQVGMGLLVHHSTPDPEELANGVATYDRASAYSRSMTLVTQDGAVSVTNPPEGSIPEEVKVRFYTSIPPTLTLVGYSNLLPLGSTVLTWDSEYRSLADLVVAVGNAFGAATGKSSYLLDFEYKKTAPDNTLLIKQVRELPRPTSVANITPFLLNELVEYCTYQGEYANVFANHRLKTRWNLQTRNAWLTTSELAASIYTDGTFEYLHDEEVRTAAGCPATWPGSTYSYTSNTTTDGWPFTGLENPRRYTLITRRVGLLVSESQTPLLTIRDLSDGSLELRTDYGKPVPIPGTSGGMTTTTTDTVQLRPARPASSSDQLQQRAMSSSPITIATRFYWPKDPGVAGGYTAPLVRWDQTTITGLTVQPIVLHGYYSQTYRPEHHNFSEHFLFEPGLEESLPPAQRAELRNKNIRLIYAYRNSSGQATITTLPFTAPGDFDHNGYVNGADVKHFAGCISGPLTPQPDVNCQDADLDHDLDVDQSDFGLFQQCYSGTKPALVTCLGS